jgi:hypothetical protein
MFKDGMALSIRQPWAWAIIHANPPKDIENRDWPTNFRGRFYVHASKGCTRNEYLEFIDTAIGILPQNIHIPGIEQLQRGGIIGSVELTDCVLEHKSPWFIGKHGFVLSNPEPMEFVPYKGRLGFFDVPQLKNAGFAKR